MGGGGMTGGGMSGGGMSQQSAPAMPSKPSKVVHIRGLPESVSVYYYCQVNLVINFSIFILEFD